MALSALILSLVNLHAVNLCMKFFDQTDVIPILSAATLIFQMVSGLIVADEINNYTGI